MATILKFIMLSDEKENFVREYEVPQEMTLADFHNFLSASLNYDESSMASFFVSDEQWRKLQEFTLMPMDLGDEGPTPTPMDEASLAQVTPRKNDRLLYQFDIFADRSFFLELVGALNAEQDAQYPRVVLARGEPPAQFDAESFADSESTIFDDVMEEFGDFEGDDMYDDDY